MSEGIAPTQLQMTQQVYTKKTETKNIDLVTQDLKNQDTKVFAEKSERKNELYDSGERGRVLNVEV